VHSRANLEPTCDCAFFFGGQGKGKNSLLAGGYWVFHRGKPIPFGNPVPSWIFEARVPGYGWARARIEGEGRGREGKNRLLED